MTTPATGMVSVAEVLDECIIAVEEAIRSGTTPYGLRVNPAVVETVLAARSREISRGIPPQLFGLTLFPSADVPLGKAELLEKRRSACEEHDG